MFSESAPQKHSDCSASLVEIQPQQVKLLLDKATTAQGFYGLKPGDPLQFQQATPIAGTIEEIVLQADGQTRICLKLANTHDSGLPVTFGTPSALPTVSKMPTAPAGIIQDLSPVSPSPSPVSVSSSSARAIETNNVDEDKVIEDEWGFQFDLPDISDYPAAPSQVAATPSSPQPAATQAEPPLSWLVSSETPSSIISAAVSPLPSAESVGAFPEPAITAEVPVYNVRDLESQLTQIESPQPPPFEAGDRIRHEKYGEGRVEKVIPMEDRLTLKVQFESVGKRLLDPELSPIEKL